MTLTTKIHFFSCLRCKVIKNNYFKIYFWLSQPSFFNTAHEKWFDDWKMVKDDQNYAFLMYQTHYDFKMVESWLENEFSHFIFVLNYLTDSFWVW